MSACLGWGECAEWAPAADLVATHLLGLDTTCPQTQDLENWELFQATMGPHYLPEALLRCQISRLSGLRSCQGNSTKGLADNEE